MSCQVANASLRCNYASRLLCPAVFTTRESSTEACYVVVPRIRHAYNERGYPYDCSSCRFVAHDSCMTLSTTSHPRWTLRTRRGHRPKQPSLGKTFRCRQCALQLNRKNSPVPKALESSMMRIYNRIEVVDHDHCGVHRNESARSRGG